MMKRETVLLAAAAACLAVAPRAQDEPKPKGHPGIPPLPGFELQDRSESHDFGAFEFSVGTPDEDKTKRVEGRTWRLEYWIHEGRKAPSPLEIARNYANAFKKAGGSVLYSKEDDGEVTLKKTAPGGGELWLHTSVSNNGEVYELDVVETAAMKQSVELTAADMAKALKASGRVALHGILFDTGKSAIKPESLKLVDEVRAMLEADESLKLLIEGHTDNVGEAKANLALSKRRSAAVKAALVASGVDEARLSAEGFGDGKPVADNKAEEGRAKNRRVELVSK
ncbi:MAG: OmpA family protein [Elusimicrobia bacterium]|nr:OmpA family protein [Elusimicrobiota bacterium]